MTSTAPRSGASSDLQDSSFRMSGGDDAGVIGGVASSKNKGKAEFVNFSFDVQFESKPVTRALAGQRAAISVRAARPEHAPA